MSQNRKDKKAKADARKERFARDERKRKEIYNPDDGDKGEGEEEMEEEDAVDDVAEWEKTKRDPLAIEQAWDNWELVKRFRVDPPSSDNKDSMEKLEEEEFIPKTVSVVPTKIHIFSIDWACFKQIRTDDLMSYFKDYGPSYVEWLGELSCNVLFEDKYSAARAFHALSQELPSPPPEDLIIARKNRRNEKDNDDKNMDEVNDGEEQGMEGVKEEGDAAAADEIVPSASEVEADGIAIDVVKKEGEETTQPEEAKPLPDYGAMGWRFCKWTVRKVRTVFCDAFSTVFPEFKVPNVIYFPIAIQVSNDRYGIRGTRARLLMRLATSNDCLDDRPSEWPKPPPGFSTKRRLMPWYDFSGKRRQGRDNRRDTKRRRGHDGRRRGRRDDDDNNVDTVDGEHPLLSKGLRSGRDGFTMEEIQAERNAKSAELLM
jgi:hypothetical protein